MHDARAALASIAIVQVDHSANPLHLARKITVVRAVRGARGYEFLTKARVRADSGKNHLCASRQIAHRFAVQAVGDD